MSRFRKQDETASITGRFFTTAVSTAALCLAAFLCSPCCCWAEPAQPPAADKPAREAPPPAVFEKAPELSEKTKAYLRGLPIVIAFPDMPEVPEKIKAAAPSISLQWPPAAVDAAKPTSDAPGAK